MPGADIGFLEWRFNSTKKDKKYVLLGGKSYVVGRRDCDILLAGDPTVSRKHAELTLSHTEANLGNVSKLPMLRLKDLSKFGTWVNKEKISGESILSDGDEIMFGSDKSMYTVVYEPLVITSSCLDNAGKKLVRQQLCILGGHMVNEWSNDCSLVVMNKISVTIKVICALVSLKHIVLPGYLQQYVKHLQGTSEKPDPAKFTPELGETQVDSSQVSFAPDSRRKTLFQGMTFVFFSQKQLKKLNHSIELAGGMTLLMETGGDDGILTEPGTVVMECQEIDLSPKAEKWQKHVNSLLDRNGKHMVQDAEIGYSVLYCSTEKHCNPDSTIGRGYSKLPSQSLSQVDVFVANTVSQHRTQTQGRTQRALPVTQNSAKTPAMTTSPDTKEQRKSSRHRLSQSPSPSKPSPPPTELRKSTKRGPSPEKPSTPHQPENKRATRRERSPSPVEQVSQGPSKRQRGRRVAKSPTPPPQQVRVKEEPISQPQSTTKKRNRPVIQDESSDEEFSVPQGNRGNKRVKVEPETPKSKTGAVEKKTARTDFVADSDDNDSDIVDEFDKIDARMRSRRKQSSTRGEGQKSGQGQRSTSLSPQRVSPSVSSRASPARLSVKGHSRSSAGKEASESVKIEVEDILPSNDLEPSRSKGRSNKGHTVEDTCDEPAVGGSRNRAAAKTEVGSDDFSMAAIPVESLEDRKPSTVNGAVMGGFLTTRNPIQDQVQPNREFQVEADQPSNCVKVEFESLVARKPPAKARDTGDCPDGFMRWQGMVVKNFKKFRKVQPSGQVGLPTVIGGSDLEVYVPHRSKEMDDWFKETLQAESQHASEERRAQELFDLKPEKRQMQRASVVNKGSLMLVSKAHSQNQEPTSWFLL